MTSDGDLSTEDLAQPTGVRRQEPAPAEEGAAGRAAQPGLGMPGGGAAEGQGWGDGGAAPGMPVSGGTADTDAGAGGRAGDEAAPGSMPGGLAAPAVGEPSAGAPTTGGHRADTAESLPGDGAATAMPEPADRAGQGGSFGQTSGTEATRGAPADGTEVALLDPADGERFRQRWSDVQARFVDDPQEAVQTADGLVAELMQSLAQGFSEHKGRLESQWQQGGNPDTEELRQALQMYRSFFNRLLAT